MTVAEICALMDEWAPADLAYSWDRSGLSIGNPSTEVSSVLVALTVTRKCLDAARKAKAQIIVSHHPVVWDPLKTLRTDDPHTKLCIEIAAEGIACFAAHTNLDIARNGVNDILAKKLNLENVAPLFPVDHAGLVKLVTFVPESHISDVRNAVCEAGAGVIGAYTHCSFSTPGAGTFMPTETTRPYSGRKHQINEEPERRFEVLVPGAKLNVVLAALRRAHPYEEIAYDVVRLLNKDTTVGIGRRGALAKSVTLKELAGRIRQALEISHVRVVGDMQRRIRTVGLLAGSGGSEVTRVPPDVDVYLTGDVKYHEAIDALARKLSVIDAGHHGTEKWIAPALAKYLKQKCKGIRVTSYMESDPFAIA